VLIVETYRIAVKLRYQGLMKKKDEKIY